jgi:hypothetical protein
MSAQPNPAFTSSLPYAQLYVTKCKFALTPLRPFDPKSQKNNSKAPSEKAWQAPANWITTEAQCRQYFQPKGKGFGKQPVGEPGIGLVHAGSGTMALDVDNVEATKKLFEHLGVDYAQVLTSTAGISRGDPSRAKAIFRLPDSAGASDVHKVVVQYNGKVAFEFRGGHGHQDALPPTVHPSGAAFLWARFDGTRESLSVLPDALWELWQHPERLNVEGFTAAGQAKKQGATGDWKPTINDQLVLDHVGDTPSMLEEAGYTRHTDGRFSKPGSDSAGMVIYPDGRAWSFHGSEPLYFGNNPHPLSPFDVFVGLMALEKGQTKQETMVEACHRLQGLANAGGGGSAPPVLPPEVVQYEPEERGALWMPRSPRYGESPVDWPELPTIMQFQGLPAIEPTPPNVDKIMRQHPALVDVFRFDEFTGKVYVVGPPWRTNQRVSLYHPEITPTGLSVFLGANSLYRRISHILLQRGIITRAMEECRVDSLRNQVQLLPKWDFRNRIDSWLIDYCGAQDTPANRYIGRKFLIGMVARAIQPGCKMDNMVIMEGKEGRGKSTLFDVLAGRLRFSDSLEHRLCTEQHLTLRGDDTKASEKMQGAWIAELPELSSFSKADRLLLVSFISRKEDAYRTPYDITVTSKPRRIMLVGTTNETGDYLENAEGNRRFWPVTIEKVKIDEVGLDRDQLLAEAMYCLSNGESWWLTEDEEVDAGLKELQRSRTSDSPLDAPGKQAIVLLSKTLLQGRTDQDKWEGCAHRTGSHGLFFSASELSQVINQMGERTNPVSVGRWLTKFFGVEKGMRSNPPHAKEMRRYCYAPTRDWLDDNLPGWKDTPVGRKIENGIGGSEIATT